MATLATSVSGNERAALELRNLTLEREVGLSHVSRAYSSARAGVPALLGCETGRSIGSTADQWRTANRPR